MSFSLFEKPTKTAKPRKLSRYSARPGQAVPKGGPRRAMEASDEYGLSPVIYRYVSPLGRRYIRRAIDHLGLDPMVAPAEQVLATVPELVVYGGLLERGFLDMTQQGMGGIGVGPRSFVFRKVWFGGGREGDRIGEVDFSIWYLDSIIGVEVDGAFHRHDHPGGTGGEAVVGDRQQREMLRALPMISRLLSVNRNFELEQGPSALVEREFQRIVGQ